jgi:hypothetical protein
MHVDSNHLAARSPVTRARVTNDVRRLHGLDARTREGRRRRDLVAIFLDALGAPPTELQLVQVRRAAELTVATESLRARVLAGEVSRHLLEALTKLEGEGRRAVRELGLKLDAPSKRAGPTLGDLLREDAAIDLDASAASPGAMRGDG